MDYVLSTSGEQFICRALSTCQRYGVTWDQLWSTKAKEAEEARRFLEFDQCEEETGKLLGAAAVVQLLQKVASREASLEETTALLKNAHLLTDDNIAFAADTFGLTEETVRSLLSPNG